MTNNKNSNSNDKENEVIYDSSKNRHENVTHQADGDTYRNGQKVREGEHHDKVVSDRDNVEHEKKSNPLKWILPLLLLLILVPLLFKFCNDNKDAEEDVKTEEKATTEAPTTEKATEEKTSDAQVKSFDLASIVNFDLVA
ncbi:hypothetical protein D6861_001560 [Macrococcoides caseolyticum]|nr:hypothetical protein [Macrococcus caseolyticus]RKO17199.1 hypothetical protein D6861_01550 [Macrococcus caseolyticus]